MTTVTTFDENKKCFAVNIDDYIIKPYKADTLIEKILKLAFRNVNMTKKHTNISYLNDVAGENTRLVVEMIAIFIEQIPEFVDEMQNHLKSQNWKELGLVAHKAKSSVAIVGMTDLSEDMDVLQQLAKDGRNPEKYPALVENFIEQCRVAEQELKDYIENTKV